MFLDFQLFFTRINRILSKEFFFSKTLAKKIIYIKDRTLREQGIDKYKTF